MAPCGSQGLGFGILANIRPSCTPYHAHKGQTKLETGYAARVLRATPPWEGVDSAGLQQRRGAPEPAMPDAASLTRSHRRAGSHLGRQTHSAPVTVRGMAGQLGQVGSTSPKVMRARYVGGGEQVGGEQLGTLDHAHGLGSPWVAPVETDVKTRRPLSMNSVGS